MLTERSGHLRSAGRLKIGAALVFTSSFIPMLFQGEEWGASTPFQYFTDHDRVSWNEPKVFIKLPRETIKQSPECSEESLITRDYETALRRHYHLEGYRIEGEADSPRNTP